MQEQALHHTVEERAVARGPQQFPASIPTFPVFSERSAEPRALLASAPHYGSQSVWVPLLTSARQSTRRGSPQD